MLIFQDCKSDPGLQRIASVSPESPEFAAYVNTGCRRLLRRGDWPCATRTIYVAAYAGAVTWPRYVGHVRRINLCHQRDVPVHNKWWEFTEQGTDCQGWGEAEASLVNMGMVPVLANVLGEGRYLRAYARCAQDYGKTVTIYGTDNNGQKLQYQSYGIWRDGNLLTLAAGYAQTPGYVRHIDYVVKDATNCPVDLYAYNESSALLEDVAHYEGSETRPAYQQSRLRTGCCSDSSCGSGATPAGVEALVKLRFIPVVNSNDLVIIDNLDAITHEVQALKLMEAGDRIGMLAAQVDAVNEMNHDLEDQSPDDQFTVTVDVLGTGTRSNACF